MEAPVRDSQSPPHEDVAELHLLISEMDDELSAYRWREAVWVSLIIHAVAFILIIFAPKWIPRGAMVIPITQQSQNNTNLTFTPLPPDQQRVKPPVTDTLSDKNRVAQSKTPLPDKEQLRKILDANRPGRPTKPTPPPAPAQQAAQQNPAEAAPPQQQAANQTPPPPQPPQQAQLQTPPQAKPTSPFKTSAPGIQQAIQSLGSGHVQTHYTFDAGNYGTNRFQPNSHIRGDVEILSDTMGVDFGPYLQRILYVIRNHWINLIPEGAQAKKGKVAIQFAILKDGRITAMQSVLPSGDIVLDRAAWGGITDSDPLDQLPREFKGDYLALRIIFLYNMDLNSNELR
jgi:outer membrane biosynthesis protein TonB